ncbi:imelysin family protein [Kiloniella antarctica]|uniref:Imelysin family protein n=1 Tax=Kiloniella antarctica TaxID=1550907 RepID=A0ABW5BN91_9PROT
MLNIRIKSPQKILSLFTGICLLPISAFAQDQIADTKTSPDFGPMIQQMIEYSVLPGYEALQNAAEREKKIISELCHNPTLTNLKKARSDYKNLVSAWSAVEMYRFGPTIKNNRQEKLFFWPDRKSIGLKQVRNLISSEDQTALTPDTLQGKSVAVQGLLALEYVLFGKGSEALSIATPASYRCTYGLTISKAMSITTQEILKGWSEPNGYADLMYNTGPDNAVYRSKGEVVQDFLRVTSEMIQSVRSLKLQNSIKDEPANSKPKRAPLWRSNLTIHAIKENLNAVVQLLNTGGLGSLTPRYTKSLEFEIEQANKFLTKLEQRPEPWPELVKQKEAHDTLAYLFIPLDGARNVTTDLIPAELGLSLGFNSLDGD